MESHCAICSHCAELGVVVSKFDARGFWVQIVWSSGSQGRKEGGAQVLSTSYGKAPCPVHPLTLSLTYTASQSSCPCAGEETDIRGIENLLQLIDGDQA